MQGPKTEVWYVFKQFAVCEGEKKRRLLTPHADPMEHEYPIDGMFESAEEAKEWKKDFAPEEDLHLVKMTLEPIEFLPASVEEE